MKQLFWKEWYELRFLPLASAVGIMTLDLGYIVYEHTLSHSSPAIVSDTFMLLLFVWHLCALVAGASLFSSEIGSGTLIFLSALPVSRHRLWAVKTATAFLALLASLVTSSLSWLIAERLSLGGGRTHAFLYELTPDHASLIVGLISVLGFFTGALAVSPLLDRVMSALAAASLVGIVSLIGLGGFAYQYLLKHFGPFENTWPTDLPLYCALGLLSILAAAAISYRTFTGGETLRSAKRFRVAALTGAVSLLTAVLAFWDGSLLQLW